MIRSTLDKIMQASISKKILDNKYQQKYKVKHKW